jgi:hypothetical protein
MHHASSGHNPSRSNVSNCFGGHHRNLDSNGLNRLQFRPRGTPAENCIRASLLEGRMRFKEAIIFNRASGSLGSPEKPLAFLMRARAIFTTFQRGSIRPPLCLLGEMPPSVFRCHLLQLRTALKVIENVEFSAKGRRATRISERHSIGAGLILHERHRTV